MDNPDQEKESKSSERKPFKEASPSEVKERVKETVAKGVAAVAGALKGFTEEAKTQHLAESSKEVIQKAGETTRTVAGGVKQEVTKTKEELQAGAKAERMGGPASDAAIARGIGEAPTGNPPTNLEKTSVSDMPNLTKTPLGTQEDLEESKGE